MRLDSQMTQTSLSQKQVGTRSTPALMPYCKLLKEGRVWAHSLETPCCVIVNVAIR